MIDFPTLDRSLQSFLRWLTSNGYTSYDQYDYWSTRYGIFAKRTYYHNHLLGSSFIAPLIILDTVFPATRRFLVQPKRFPIADAHLILGFLNCYQVANDHQYLSKAKEIAQELILSSIGGYSGHCWGYPFDWQTNRGLWKKEIPFITTTPYCFEAFLDLYDTTHEQKYLDIAHSSFLFAINDLKESREGPTIAACTYSPLDSTKVLNANAYRAYMLLEGYKRFGESVALEKAKKNINYILAHQNEDGSWLYAMENPQDNFIDNFHTCFVLKNLYKANQVLHDTQISAAIERGYAYYRKNLFYTDGTPKPFSKIGRLALVKIELYDYAEGIILNLLLCKEFNDAMDIADHLVSEVLTKYQKKDGSFITRINFGGIRNTVPYLRWPQAQLFYALTNYYKVKQQCAA
jgi:hypothetical protein